MIYVNIFSNRCQNSAHNLLKLQLDFSLRRYGLIKSNNFLPDQLDGGRAYKHTQICNKLLQQLHINKYMAGRQHSRYEHISKIEDDLSEQISNLKVISNSINKQLKKQQKTRQGLEEYLDAGIEGLKKTNQMLTDLLGTRSLFGCNLCILFGISLLVILILLFI